MYFFATYFPFPFLPFSCSLFISFSLPVPFLFSLLFPFAPIFLPSLHFISFSTPLAFLPFLYFLPPFLPLSPLTCHYITSRFVRLFSLFSFFSFFLPVLPFMLPFRSFFPFSPFSFSIISFSCFLPFSSSSSFFFFFFPPRQTELKEMERQMSFICVPNLKHRARRPSPLDYRTHTLHAFRCASTVLVILLPSN